MNAEHLSRPGRSLFAERPDWRQAHEELSRLAKARAHLDWEEARWLVVALRFGAHLALGFASFAEYIERLFGYGPRWTSERLRVAEALEHLPEIAQALRDGVVNWSAARELTRVAVPENEHQWLGVARGRTLRQIEELVSGHQLGDSPGEPSTGSTSRHVLRFEVSSETFSTFREAMAKLRRDSGEPLDDDDQLLLMARQVLGGPTDEGRSSYQVALTVCEECGRAWQQGAGTPILVDSSVAEMTCCDAQHIRQVSPDGTNAEDGPLPPVPDTHVGRPKPTRARQDIPPAVRRHVMRRDRGRCAVPGCRHGVFLDVHHVKLRSEGGDHDPDGLVVLCSAHHRAAHRGQLWIDGRVSTGLVFRHADGSRYGAPVEPLAAEALAQAFRALRALGFREDQSRRAVEQVRMDGLADKSTEELLRAALGKLSPACSRHSAVETSA